MKPYPFIVKRKVRKNGRITFLIYSWFIDRYYSLNDQEYNTFVDAVLQVRKIQGNQTQEIKTVFGKIE